MKLKPRRIRQLECRNPALPGQFGKTWWKMFKCRTSVFVSRIAQNVESQRACARLTPQQWTEFFHNHLKPCLEKVVYNPCHMWNEDESRFFRQFSTVGQRVWVRKGRKTMARRRGWQCQHVIAIVAVDAQG